MDGIGAVSTFPGGSLCSLSNENPDKQGTPKTISGLDSTQNVTKARESGHTTEILIVGVIIRVQFPIIGRFLTRSTSANGI